jgi:predicted AlkP superfamily pyrophosphatase or phosphodiesterase
LDFNAVKEEELQFVTRHSFLGKFVLPDYPQFNITNIGSVVGKIFSIKDLEKANLPSDIIDDYSGAEKVVLFVFDGLGFNRLVSHMEKFGGTFLDLADKGVLKAFSSTFPSTTSTALTSIYTGLPPSEHGVIGFNMFVPEYGAIFNTLYMDPVIGYRGGFDLAEDLSRYAVPWLPLLSEGGVEVKTFTRRNLIGSGLSRVIHKHQELVGYSFASDMIVRVRKALEQPGLLFLCVYYAGVDTMEHQYGPYSEETSSELQDLGHLLKQQLLQKLSAEEKRKTLILVTADHGAEEVLRTRYLNAPEFSSHFLVPPTGDMRASYFFPRYGQEDKLRGLLESNLQGFSVMRSADLIEKGAFGPVRNLDRLQTVVGALAALSHSKDVILYEYHPGEKLQNVSGAHGGMTPEEMIVPLLSTRLSHL